jgi:hypothetical protein
MMRTLAPLFVLLAACDRTERRDGEDVTLLVDNATITLALLDPTVDAEPLEGVSSMRIDVIVDDEVMISESFDYPDGDANLAGVAEFGVVRFEVAGSDGSSVRSFGRSAEVVVEPGEDLWVPITFLPANRVFALAEAMHQPRSDHAAIPLPDGRILLLGGNNPNRSSSYADIEYFDFYEGVFSAPGASLEVGVSGTQWAWTSGSQLLFFGGENAGSGAQDGVWLYDPVQDAVGRIANLIRARSDHCGAQYIDNSVIVLGGEGTGSQADLLRYYTDSLTWSSTTLPLENGMSSEDTVGCGVAEDGRVFVLGTEQSNTGILDPFRGTGIGDGFTPITAAAAGSFVSDAVILRIEPDVFWIGGGIDLGTGIVTSEGQEFRMESAGFVGSTPLAVPRQGASWSDWIVDGWYAVACGYSDPDQRSPVNKVELLNPATGAKGPTVDLDRSRPGCAVSSLPDGSLLLTGGFDGSGGPDAATAAIMVPYFGD